MALVAGQAVEVLRAGGQCVYWAHGFTFAGYDMNPHTGLCNVLVRISDGPFEGGLVRFAPNYVRASKGAS